MIPPQLVMIAAKYGKYILVGLVVLIVMFSIWLAFQHYENLQQKLVESEANRAASNIALETTTQSLEVQRNATKQWQVQAEAYKETLDEQESVRRAAREEGRKIDETLREHDLEKLATAKPELVERVVNRATDRIIRLLNCSSTARGCDGDSRATGQDTADPLPGATGPRELRVDGNGPKPLERSGQGLLLSRYERLRIRGP